HFQCRTFVRSVTSPNLLNSFLFLEMRQSACRRSGTVQKLVTPQGWLGSTPDGRRSQIRGMRAGGWLAVAASTTGTQVLSPPKMRKLNQAGSRAAR
ncbi:MAG: hypothetical protein ACLQIB_25900, partial [Isosphaeraceae bacterium]